MHGALQSQLRRLFPGCAGKTKYETESAAVIDRDRIFEENATAGKDDKSLGLNVYRCRTCLQWHIGRDVRKGGVA